MREFDIVTWDRLKRIDVEPDFEIWKEYAYKFSVHPAVLTYLEIKKGNFYKVETTVNGKTFVTARGWDDLSSIIRVFERHNLPVDEKLIAQYLQNGKIAKDFAIYYDLFNKYRSDYQVDKILAGTVPDSILGRAMSAKFDERLSLLGLLLDAVSEDVLLVATVDNTNRRLLDSLKKLRLQMGTAGCEPLKAIDSEIASLDAELEQGKRSGSISAEKQLILKQTAAILARERGLIDERTDLKTAFNLLRADFYRRLTDAKKLPVTVGKELDNLFAFCERTFEDGNELIILVTELTANPHTANFISTYGCPAYFRHNKELLFYERSREIVENLELMDLG